MDREVVEQKLESLIRCLDRVETKCPATADELVANIDLQDIISLNLTRAVQACVDIALHWAAQTPNVKSPATMGEAFELMASAGALTDDVATNLRKAVGFRNVAVHNYDEIDWAIVFSICTTRLRDFREFARAVDAIFLQ